jgi:plastocyanin
MRCLYYSLLASLAFIYSVVAQSATTSSSPSTQTVVVGYNSHSFHPNNITASPGSTIVFQFIAPGHTVVQSNFEEPCVPRDAYHRGLSTFFSGWHNGSDTQSDHVSFAFLEPDTPEALAGIHFCSKKKSPIAVVSLSRQLISRLENRKHH